MKSSPSTKSSSSSNGGLAQGTASLAPSATTHANGTTKANGVSPSSSRAARSPGTATTANGTAEPSRTLSEKHAKWLEERGIDLEIAVRLGLHSLPGKFAGGGALVFPIVRDGQAINHKYRGPSKTFQLDAGAPHGFWNEDVLRDESLAALPVLITEGELDGIVGVQVAYGLVRTVSVIGGASSNLGFMKDIWPLLERVPHFILGGDGDGPGQKLNAELARRLGAARCSWLEYPEGKDLNDVLRARGEAAARAVIESAKPYPIAGLYRMSEFPEVGQLEVFDTGWPILNPYLKLWVPELMVITGIPTHGKSKLALHMLAQQVEKYGAKCAIFSAEVPYKPHVQEELRGFHRGSHAEADRWVDDNFIFMASNPASDEVVDVDWLIEKGSDAVIRYGVNWMLVDPWNQVEHRRDREGVEEYQERALRAINKFRRSFQCGVIIVAHPTKEVKGKDGKLRVPGLYDISGSAHWYNAPDHGLVVHRPNGSGRYCQVHVLKARFARSGHNGFAWLRFEIEGQDAGRYVSSSTGPDGAA